MRWFALISNRLHIDFIFLMFSESTHASQAREIDIWRFWIILCWCTFLCHINHKKSIPINMQSSFLWSNRTFIACWPLCVQNIMFVRYKCIAGLALIETNVLACTYNGLSCQCSSANLLYRHPLVKRRFVNTKAYCCAKYPTIVVAISAWLQLSWSGQYFLPAPAQQYIILVVLLKLPMPHTSGNVKTPILRKLSYFIYCRYLSCQVHM